MPDDEREGSVPYIHKDAKVVLDGLAADIHNTGKRDDDFMDTLNQAGFNDFMCSLYSFTRITPYQAYIASQGRFAVGSDGVEAVSTHERAKATDIDHAGFYGLRGDEIVSLNRESSEENFRVLARALPKYREILARVIGNYVAEDMIMALHELPQGWGGYHVAVKR